MLPHCPYCGDDLEPLVLGTINPAKLYEEPNQTRHDVIEVIQSCETCKIKITHKVTVEVESTRE